MLTQRAQQGLRAFLLAGILRHVGNEDRQRDGDELEDLFVGTACFRGDAAYGSFVREASTQ